MHRVPEASLAAGVAVVAKAPATGKAKPNVLRARAWEQNKAGRPWSTRPNKKSAPEPTASTAQPTGLAANSKGDDSND